MSIVNITEREQDLMCQLAELKSELQAKSEMLDEQVGFSIDLANQRDALKAEIKVQTKAADHWMSEACRDHNATIKAEEEIAALKAQKLVAWNPIQIATWVGNQLMTEPSMFERHEVCKYVHSLGRDPRFIKHLAAGTKLYTADALQDVLEQAAKGIENLQYGWSSDGQCACIAAIRRMKEQIK